MTGRLALALALGLVAVTGGRAPEAAAAKPRLYTVALSGEIRNEFTLVTSDTRTPPSGCLGSDTETRRFSASARLAPMREPERLLSYAGSFGWLRFPAALTSLRTSASTELTNNYSPDPEDPPPDPSVCTVAAESKTSSCFVAPEATRSGASFALRPENGRYVIGYTKFRGILDCGDFYQGHLFERHPIDLRVKAVRRLARGRSAKASGTSYVPEDSGSGGETLRYTVKVTRVR